MNAEQYSQKLQEKFHQMKCKLEHDHLGKYSVIIASGVDKGGSFFTTKYFYIYVHQSYYEMELHGFLDFIDIVRINTGRFFNKLKFLRMKAAFSIPIIISGSGFTSETIENVQKTNRLNIGEIIIPILINLPQNRFITLERYGFIGRIPYGFEANYLKKTFNLF